MYYFSQNHKLAIFISLFLFVTSITVQEAKSKAVESTNATCPKIKTNSIGGYSNAKIWNQLNLSNSLITFKNIKVESESSGGYITGSENQNVECKYAVKSVEFTIAQKCDPEWNGYLIEISNLTYPKTAEFSSATIRVSSSIGSDKTVGTGCTFKGEVKDSKFVATFNRDN